jgi:hypothetical protein
MAYTVTRVEDVQDEDAAGELVNLYQITFTLSDKPGQWVVQIPKTGNPVADAAAAIQKIVDEVSAIYGLTG